MLKIYYLLTFLMFWLHISALTAAGGLRFNSWAITRASMLLLTVMVLFCVEHLVGLGSLRYVWPFTSALSAYYLWRKRDYLLENDFLKSEIAFGWCLSYLVLWRYLYPTIYHTSERITDLVMINNYLDGTTLPPPDQWQPPYNFDFYYSMMHYAAALAGRILQMPNGLTYNFCFIMINGVSLALAWDFISRFVSKRSSRLLLIAALACGGTGASLFNHFITPEPTDTPDYNAFIWGSARFIGGYETMFKNELGEKLFPRPKEPGFEPRELGMENFGYQFFVFDYHPPVAGFFMLLLALAIIGALEQRSYGEIKESWQKTRELSFLPQNQALQFMLGLSATAIIALNTWTFPLQALLVGGWALWRTIEGRTQPNRNPSWIYLIGGGVTGLLLLYPFLVTFTNREVPTPITWVKWDDHTPLSPFIAQFWPILVMIALGLLQQKTRKLCVFFALFFTALFIMSEIVYVDDGSGGKADRLNTTMKWWGWIWTGCLVTLGTLLLADKRISVRLPVVIGLVALCVHFYDIGRYWKHHVSSDMGFFHGTDLWTRDMAYADMFRFLNAAPKGIVVENHYTEGYHEGGAFAAFSRKPLLVGWINQVITWHTWNDEIGELRDGIRNFYAGKMDNPGLWMSDKNVSYIVWNKKDADAVEKSVWERNNSSLSQNYVWRPFATHNEKSVGIWVRKDQNNVYTIK